MPDDDNLIGLGRPVYPGATPDGTAEWTRIRCMGCGREGYTLTATLPLFPPEAGAPLRDDDGVRLAFCVNCVLRAVNQDGEDDD